MPTDDGPRTVGSTATPACYFPLANGRYEVKPGLVPLGSDFGNGAVDRCVFQIDRQFADYRQVKLQARAERLSKYYQTYRHSPEVAGAIAHLIVDRLTHEYPTHFTLQPSLTLACHLTGEVLLFDSNWQLQAAQSHTSYVSALDALACQVQEDFAIVCRAVDGANWLSAIHLCYPNHWSAEEKIGRDFATVHAPVAGMDAMNRRSTAIVHTMIARKPMVRFAWGLSTDTRLNHHPELPVGVAAAEWQGRQFNALQPQLYLRIERQVIWGLPEQDAALFAIRTYFRDCHTVKQDAVLRSQLVSALRSMSPESLVYKGLVESRDSILVWLDEP
ncbi:DUF3445 domain-containing protein [Leptolyngbya sp. FACHB-36]|uniref:heme-dependent oxidative N-demethylase family protein n=1 Tax=Leptolyngbya sp. FACHB-36 TaxID=2692808 RepID=UPI0016805F01|nr:DUF3445 domain-containing protein [Leptolyngbya sp. FACHB-36]MBD2020852.1 DUF3445 domain-containing protein [Leptolyngbya sp. FACHB-36]